MEPHVCHMQKEPGGWKYGGELAGRAGRREEVVGEEEKPTRYEFSRVGRQLVGWLEACLCSK